MLRLRDAVPWLGAMALLGGVPPAAIGQEQISPYVDETDRDIKALSSEQVAGLLEGAGLGFAKAAELNGVPGPRHVLELGADLDLDEQQLKEIKAVYDRMHGEAVELGAVVVELEQRLDRAFRDELPDAAQVEGLSIEIGDARGRLRATHLVAHLDTAKLLTLAQISRYGHLRGYSEHPGHDEHEAGHPPEGGSSRDEP